MESDASFMPLVNILISLAGIFCLIMRHSIKSKWVNYYLPNELRRNTVVADIHDVDDFATRTKEKKTRSPYRKEFWLEVLVFLILPLPWYDPVIELVSWNIKDDDET